MSRSSREEECVSAGLLTVLATGSACFAFEPDVRISRIRLSDKSSRLHPRHVVPKPGQAYEPEVPVKVREWIGPSPASPGFVLDAQPPAQPHSGVVVDRPVRFGDGAYLEVVRPSTQRAVQLG